MEYPYIKNITHEKVQTLTSLVNAEDGQIVSKTLAQNEAVSVTLFAFAKGEEISTHDSTGDAMVTVLEGTGRFTVDGIEHLVPRRAADGLRVGEERPQRDVGESALHALIGI